MNNRLAAAFLFGAIQMANVAAAGEPIKVEVYVQRGSLNQTMNLAQGIATELFKRIDVRIAWHNGHIPESKRSSRLAIGIRMLERAPVTATPFALAGAYPFGFAGPEINIYEDRMQRMMNRLANLGGILLAYVFTHELAHIMQGTDYHAEAGIMRADWSHADHMGMLTYQLSFTDSDADRIRDGLSRWLIASR